MLMNCLELFVHGDNHIFQV